MNGREFWNRLPTGAAIAAVAAQFQFGCCDAFAQGDLTKRLLGTWRLIDIRNDKGEQIRGPKPTGLLFYDSAGNMAVQIMPDWERPKFALGRATPEQAKAAIDAYSAYFGTYSVDDQAATVTHRRSGNINPGDMGDFVRQVEFQEPNRLILKTRGTNNQIVWERVSQ
jgi:hypothetical protein